MADNLSPVERRKTMRAVKGSDTGIERRLFSTLAGMHLSGWRKNDPTTPGKPDVVFYTQHIAIFIDGCFWHGCPRCKRKLPQTNRDYWQQKINHNRQRARTINRRLRADGWTVFRLWEHETRDQHKMLAFKAKLISALNAAQWEVGHGRQDARENNAR